jgi:hypothetical protein
MKSKCAATNRLSGKQWVLPLLFIWSAGFAAPQDAVAPAVDETQDLQKIISGLAMRQYRVRLDAKKELAELKPPHDAAAAQVNAAWRAGEIDSAERERRMAELKTQYDQRRTNVIEQRDQALAEIQREADSYAAKGGLDNAAMQ